MAPQIRVLCGSYTGTASAEATDLIVDSAKAQNVSSRPRYMAVAESAKEAGDYLLIPSDEESDDNLDVEWYDRGRKVRLDLARLLTYAGVVIPPGSAMVISVYAEEDREFGACVGLRIKTATFEALKERPTRKPVEA